MAVNGFSFPLPKQNMCMGSCAPLKKPFLSVYCLNDPKSEGLISSKYKNCRGVPTSNHRYPN